MVRISVSVILIALSSQFFAGIALAQAPKGPADFAFASAERAYSACAGKKMSTAVWNTALSVDDAVKKVLENCESLLLEAHTAYLQTLQNMSEQERERRASSYVDHRREMEWRVSAMLVSQLRHSCITLRETYAMCKKDYVPD